MPRRQNKHKTHAKRREKQNETRKSEATQEAAAAAQESSPAPQRGPVAESCSSSQEELQGAASATATPAGGSSSKSDSPTASQMQEWENVFKKLLGSDSSDRNLNMMTLLLEQYMLYKFKMKKPILKADLLQIIDPSYEDRFDEILKKACEHISVVFAVEVKEADSDVPSYNLISKLKLPNNGRVRPGRGLPKTGLVMAILGMIFLKGNRASEEDIWKLLNAMGVYDGRRHLVYGEPRKLITKDLVRLQYLEYQQVPGSDPACYEFLWGPKAHAETSKMKVLVFMAKLNDTVPSAFAPQYEEALRDEQERARRQRAAGAAFQSPRPACSSTCSHHPKK